MVAEGELSALPFYRRVGSTEITPETNIISSPITSLVAAVNSFTVRVP